MKAKVAHIIVTDKCGNHCPMCCNRNYDIHTIPNITQDELTGLETICLTGGEPFLSPEIKDYIGYLRPYCKNLYVYASGYELYLYWKKFKTLHDISGLSISPKTLRDWRAVLMLFHDRDFASYLIDKVNKNRLYVFVKQYGLSGCVCEETDEIVYDVIHTAACLPFTIIFREWKEEITSPEGEIFRNIDFSELGL